MQKHYSGSFRVRMWGLYIHYAMQFANSTALQLAVRVKGSSTLIRGAEWVEEPSVASDENRGGRF